MSEKAPQETLEHRESDARRAQVRVGCDASTTRGPRSPRNRAMQSARVPACDRRRRGRKTRRIGLHENGLTRGGRATDEKVTKDVRLERATHFGFDRNTSRVLIWESLGDPQRMLGGLSADTEHRT